MDKFYNLFESIVNFLEVHKKDINMTLFVSMIISAIVTLILFFVYLGEGNKLSNMNKSDSTVTEINNMKKTLQNLLIAAIVFLFLTVIFSLLWVPTRG
jgi:Na+/H+ antiporter NhaC